MATLEQVTYNSPDGATIGASPTEKVSFYGETPVVQAASVASVTTTAATSTTNAYGYTTAAQADAIVTAVNAIKVALTNIGILSDT